MGCNIVLMKRFLPLLILTGLLFGQEGTQYSGFERNNIFKQSDKEDGAVEMIIYAETIGLGSLIISGIIFWFFAHVLLFVFLEPDDYRDFSWGSVNSGLLLIYGLIILAWFFLKN